LEASVPVLPVPPPLAVPAASTWIRPAVAETPDDEHTEAEEADEPADDGADEPDEPIEAAKVATPPAADSRRRMGRPIQSPGFRAYLQRANCATSVVASLPSMVRMVLRGIGVEGADAPAESIEAARAEYERGVAWITQTRPKSAYSGFFGAWRRWARFRGYVPDDRRKGSVAEDLRAEIRAFLGPPVSTAPAIPGLSPPPSLDAARIRKARIGLLAVARWLHPDPSQATMIESLRRYEGAGAADWQAVAVALPQGTGAIGLGLLPPALLAAARAFAGDTPGTPIVPFRPGGRPASARTIEAWGEGGA
jgi:hypothetical protein